MKTIESQLEQVERVFEVKAYPKRTKKQNNSIHCGCDLLADVLNDGGLAIQKVMMIILEKKWEMLLVKELLYKVYAKNMFEVDSTTLLDTQQVSEVWEELMKDLGEQFFVEYIPFPSKEQADEWVKKRKKTHCKNT